MTATRSALLAIVVASWAALVVLVQRLVAQDYSLRAVAGYARSGASGAYRLAGAWASPEGSLVVWIAVLATVLTVTLWRAPPRIQVVALITVVGFAVISIFLANPFTRLASAPADGRGMSPILETPSMLIHPPLLYCGLALAIAAGLRGHRGGDRRLVLVAWSVLLVAMLLGSRWSYTEVGWGGYWAWDPVENAGLVPWLLLGSIMHAPLDRNRVRSVLLGVTAVAATLGVALARSGSISAVHSFAESTAVGWATLGVAVATAMALRWSTAGIRSVEAETSSDAASAPIGRGELVAVAGPLMMAGVVAIGTARPLVGRLLGADAVAIEPRFFALFTVPLAALLLTGLACRGLSAPVVLATVAAVGALAMAARGWSALAAVGFGLAVATVAAMVRSAVDHRIGWPDATIHVGAALLLGGIAATTMGLSAAATLDRDERRTVAGVEIVNRGIDVDDNTITATIDVATATVHPRLIGYPARRLVLPEPALISGAGGDVQVVLRSADDGGRALVEVTTTPLAWMVWSGALVMAAGGTGGILSALRPRRRRADAPLEPVDALPPATH